MLLRRKEKKKKKKKEKEKEHKIILYYFGQLSPLFKSSSQVLRESFPVQKHNSLLRARKRFFQNKNKREKGKRCLHIKSSATVAYQTVNLKKRSV